MRLIRQALGLAVQRFEALFEPAKTSRLLPGLSLYHYPACPFCIKVRRQLRRLGIAVELCDIDSDRALRAELIGRGGKSQVPCLRIEGGESVRWLYESDAIIAYLRTRVDADGTR